MMLSASKSPLFQGGPHFCSFFFGGGVEVTDFSRDFSASDLVGLRMGNVGYRCSEAIAKGTGN